MSSNFIPNVFKMVRETAFYCVLIFIIIFITVTCALPAFIIRACIIRYKQLRARIGLNKYRQGLLKELWKKEVSCLQYSHVNQRDYYNACRAVDVISKQADELIDQCRQESIEEWRIDAFRMFSYDYWWWQLTCVDWWD